jgi:hypothetical protein
MANSLWTNFISFGQRMVLGDPKFRYAPTAMANVLEQRFPSDTHNGYLLPGAMLGRIIYRGHRSLIFYPVADVKTSQTQEFSMSDLFEKCHQEFITEFLLKSRTYDYLIFPVALQHRQHWATLVYEVGTKTLLLIDSSSSLISKHEDHTHFVGELRTIFSRYELEIESFHYVFQGFQKDNVHCGAWTLANIIAIDGFGLAEYVQQIETFYLEYLNPSRLLQCSSKSQDSEEDYVFVEYEDLEERFEEIKQTKSEESIQEARYIPSLEALMPNLHTVQRWQKDILDKLARQITNERLILKALMQRDNVQFQKQFLHQYGIEHLKLTELIDDLDSQQISFKIKDPGRQKTRFNALGFNDWIEKQTTASQVIFEALLHDACSFEPMVQNLYGRCEWIIQLGLLEVYLEKVKLIERQLSLKVIEFFVDAQKQQHLAWQKPKTREPTGHYLDWFPKVLVTHVNMFVGSKILLEMLDDINQRFNDRRVVMASGFS